MKFEKIDARRNSNCAKIISTTNDGKTWKPFNRVHNISKQDTIPFVVN